MDVSDFSSSLKWDRERLGDLAGPLDDRGAQISVSVIQEICPELAQCHSVGCLALSLYQKKILNQEDYLQLTQPTATGNLLSSILVKASFENQGRGKHLVKSLYLSLLDVFLDRCDQWCHYAALNVVRKNAVEQLGASFPQLSISQEIDLKRVVAQFPHVILPSYAACHLRRNLNLHGTAEEITDLQSILVEYTGSECSLCGLVKAMMITEGVGRHVSKLLPFHQSYPVELLLFLDKLGNYWKDFALFLGFTGSDVDALQSSYGSTKQEIRNFSKVWRMPDLTTRKNEEVLDCVLQITGIDLATINEQSLSMSGSPSGFRSSSGRFSRQASYCGPDSPSMTSQRGSLRRDGNMASGRRPIGELRSAQGSGSSDRSVDSDIFPLVRQQSQWSATSDVDTSLSSLHQYQRQSNDLPNESAPISPHPTSSEPMQSSSPGSHPKQQLLVAPEQYVAPPLGSLCTSSPTHPCTNVAEAFSSLQIHSDETTTFNSDDEISPDSTPKYLGTGLYGEVLEVEHNSKTYAAKEYRSGLISPEGLKSIFVEKLIGLKHPNIVPYFGVCRITGRDRPVVLMEKLETNLATFLEAHTKNEKRDIEPQRKLSILRDIADGLAFLHSRKPILIHCDLTARNVLLTAELTAKIADYGNSHVEPIVDIQGRPTDTSYLDYLPLEAKEGGKYDDRLDVFSFGHLSIYVILQYEPHPLAKPTYRENGILKARSEVKRREKYLEKMKQKISNGTLHPLLEYTKDCLKDEAIERPQIVDVLKSIILYSQ